VGAIVSKLHGPRCGFPGYVAVPGTTRPGPPPTNEFGGGWLGREYAPFCTGGAPRHEDFTARVREAAEDEFHRQGLQFAEGITLTRLGGRRSLREQLDAGLKRLESGGQEVTLARQYQGAFAMLMAPNVRRAFD